MRIAMVIVALAAAVGSVGVIRVRADAPAWDGFANAWIASHALKVKGQAPREQRRSCEGDLNGDGRPDVVVVYTIEGVGGGNDWTQYATALTATPQGYAATVPIAVARKDERGVERCRIADAAVELQIKENSPSDPSCCPSRPATARYVLKAGALVEAAAPAPSPR